MATVRLSNGVVRQVDSEAVAPRRAGDSPIAPESVTIVSIYACQVRGLLVAISNLSEQRTRLTD
jgi:hypothetical protein